MLSVPVLLGAVTVFAIFLTSTQSILASAVLTGALVSVVHFYATIALGALAALALAALVGWYARTAPGGAYTSQDHQAIARLRTHRRR